MDGWGRYLALNSKECAGHLTSKKPFLAKIPSKPISVGQVTHFMDSLNALKNTFYGADFRLLHGKGCCPYSMEQLLMRPQKMISSF